MKAVFAFIYLTLLLSSPSYAQAPVRDKAVDACKSELGPRFQRPELMACVERKMDAARAAGKAKPKSGEACKYSTAGAKC